MGVCQAVRTKFFDNGRCEVTRWVEEAKEKPYNVQETNERFDMYIDWFENKAEADAFFKEALTEGAKVV